MKGAPELLPNVNDIIKHYSDICLKPIYVSCTDDMAYKPWGFFQKLYSILFSQSVTKGLITPDVNTANFGEVNNLILENQSKFSSPEDARFTYLQLFTSILESILFI